MCSEAIVFFFFKQKTAYELRISDWSSDVCSSDLLLRIRARIGQEILEGIAALFTADRPVERVIATAEALRHRRHIGRRDLECGDRKSVVEGKSVSVRVDLGGRRILNKNNTATEFMH